MNSYERKRRSLLQRRNWSTGEERNPMLVFAFMGETDIRCTSYDSTGTWHKYLIEHVGPIALVPFNLPLNGQLKQFENVCSGPGDYLLFHKDEKSVISDEEKARLAESLKKIKAAHRQLKIYVTEEAAELMSKKINFTTIKSPKELFQKLPKR